MDMGDAVLQGCRSRGGEGRFAKGPQILTDQFNLNQGPGGHIMPTILLVPTPEFSDIPTALLHTISALHT